MFSGFNGIGIMDNVVINGYIVIFLDSIRGGSMGISCINYLVGSRNDGIIFLDYGYYGRGINEVY